MPSAQISTQYFFDRKLLEELVDAATKKILSKAGGTVRLIARRSIRKRKGTSKPGNPPFTHTNFLREDIVYAFDPTTQSVVVGPYRQPWLNEIHEFGGTLVLNEFRLLGSDATFYYRRAPKSRRKYVATGAKKTLNYPPRPFMRPAMIKAAPKLPELWRNSIRR